MDIEWTYWLRIDCQIRQQRANCARCKAFDNFRDKRIPKFSRFAFKRFQPLLMVIELPSLSQAQRLKNFSAEGRLNEGSMLAVMSEGKKPEKNDLQQFHFNLRKMMFFPPAYGGGGGKTQTHLHNQLEML